MIDEKNVSDQLVKSDMKTYDNIQKIESDQVEQCKTGCLLDYPYFKDYCKMIAIDLSKKQALDADLKAIQQLILLDI